jgi:uncharacterized protein YdhG (YjbR/CyaY superfamily)
MARPRAIDAYLATLDADARRTLEAVRASILQAAPQAEETISYGFPAFRLNGQLLACVRGARAHCSYHPMSGRIVAANREALAGFDTSAGTIRFPIGKPLPARIVRLLVRARIAELGGVAVAKATSRTVKSRKAQRATPAAARTASPEIAIRGFLAKYDPAIARQLRACRRAIRGRIPRGFEMVYDNYNALVFGFSPSERTSDALLSIAGYPRWVTLFLLKGASVADPDGLLEGTGSQVRGLTLAGPGDLDAPAVRALIARALAPAARTFATAPPLRTIVKSVSARQRPRRPA